MKIIGLQKLSMVDWDGYMSATIFLNGCNFMCPFCHNSSLVNGSDPEIPEFEVIEFLKKRINILDSVCISGGEPTLYPDLPELIKKIKDMGYLIKLDTNGTNPEMIEYLVEQKLVDYIAMDIKNCLDKYILTIGKHFQLDNIQKSIKYIMTCGIDYEFRTTLVEEFHTKEDIEKIAKLIKGAKKYYLQKFEDSGHCLQSGLNSVSLNTAREYLTILNKNIPNTKLRGY